MRGDQGSRPPLVGETQPAPHRRQHGSVALAALPALSLSGPRQAETPSKEMLAPWTEQLESLLTAEHLQVTRVQELLAERGCEVSYSSLRRFIERRGWRRRQQPTVRMEDGPPGEVAEMDFGRLGLITDPEPGRRRTVWALIRGLALLAALLRPAHHEPDAARGGQGLGGGLGLLRERALLPRHRQRPGRRGRGRPAAPTLHEGLPRVRSGRRAASTPSAIARCVLLVPIGPAMTGSGSASLAHDPIAVPIIHIRVGGVTAAHGGDAVSARLGACDAAVPIVIVELKSAALRA